MVLILPQEDLYLQPLLIAELLDGQQALEVDFVYNQDGVEFIKRFEFRASDYKIGVRYIIRNLSSEPWSATFYGQFRRDSHQPEIDSPTGMKPFGGSYSGE